MYYLTDDKGIDVIFKTIEDREAHILELIECYNTKFHVLFADGEAFFFGIKKRKLFLGIKKAKYINMAFFDNFITVLTFINKCNE